MPQNALDTLNIALNLLQPDIPHELKFLVYNTFARASFETNNLSKVKQAFDSAQKYKQHITAYEVEFKTKEKEAELILLHELRKQEQLSFRLKKIIAIFTFISCVLIILLLVMILRRHRYNFNLRELKLRQEIDEQYISGLELSCRDINPFVANQVNTIRKEIRFISHTLASPEFSDVSLKQWQRF